MQPPGPVSGYVDELDIELDRELEKVAGQIGRAKLRSWNDAKAREQTRGLILANLEAIEASRVRRGKLWTVEAVRERDGKRTELILSKIPQLVDAAVALAPPERQPEFRNHMDQAVLRFRADVAAAIKESSRL